jgi:hypothetical protein
VTPSPEPSSATDPQEQGPIAGEEHEAIDALAETVDALPVLADRPALPRPRISRRSARLPARAGAATIPAVQAAAVAAGAAVAGAAVAGLVHRRQRRTPALAGGGRIGRALSRGGSGKGRGGAELVEIVGSRTLLVDVHLLGVPSSDR